MSCGWLLLDYLWITVGDFVSWLQHGWYLICLRNPFSSLLSFHSCKDRLLASRGSIRYWFNSVVTLPCYWRKFLCIRGFRQTFKVGRGASDIHLENISSKLASDVTPGGASSCWSLSSWLKWFWTGTSNLVVFYKLVIAHSSGSNIVVLCCLDWCFR